jgi:hypothetical protein
MPISDLDNEISYGDYLENPENYISVLIYKAPEED